MNEKKICSLLGLACRARKLVGGEFSVEEAIKSQEALLVIIAEDASGNTKKKFQDKCLFRTVPYVYFGEKEVLGHSIGTQERAVIAIKEQGFADAIGKLLNADNGGRNQNGKNEDL